MAREFRPSPKPKATVGIGRGVSLTYEAIDELAELVKTVREALQPVVLPPENQRDKAVWRKCVRSAKSRIKKARKMRASQVQGPLIGSSHRIRRADPRELREELQERVRQPAEDEYRRRDPLLARQARQREEPLEEALPRLRELLEWHRPALKAEWKQKGRDLKGMLELYDLASSGSPAWSPALDHVLQDLLEMRLRLEQAHRSAAARTTDAQTAGGDKRAGAGCAPSPVDDNAFLSPAQLAERFKISDRLEALKKRLARLRKTDLNCFIEVSERGPHDAQFLYRVGTARPIIEDLRTSR